MNEQPQTFNYTCELNEYKTAEELRQQIDAWVGETCTEFTHCATQNLIKFLSRPNQLLKRSEARTFVRGYYDTYHAGDYEDVFKEPVPLGHMAFWNGDKDKDRMIVKFVQHASKPVSAAHQKIIAAYKSLDPGLDLNTFVCGRDVGFGELQSMTFDADHFLQDLLDYAEVETGGCSYLDAELNSCDFAFTNYETREVSEIFNIRPTKTYSPERVKVMIGGQECTPATLEQFKHTTISPEPEDKFENFLWHLRKACMKIPLPRKLHTSQENVSAMCHGLGLLRVPLLMKLGRLEEFDVLGVMPSMPGDFYIESVTGENTDFHVPWIDIASQEIDQIGDKAGREAGHITDCHVKGCPYPAVFSAVMGNATSVCYAGHRSDDPAVASTATA